MNRNGKYLLDTNIVIALFAGETIIQEKIRNVEFIGVTPTVIGELYYGAKKSNEVTANIQKIDILVRQTEFLSHDLETARWYGIIKEILERKGSLIPDNDIWLASVAMQHELILVTRDSHFDEVESLQKEHW